MKRWVGIGVIVAVALLGAVAWGLQHRQARDSLVSSVGGKPITKPSTGPPPKIEAPETRHNFGTMDQEQTGHHSFEISSDGPGELQIGFANTTCACTRVKFKDLEWNPQKQPAPPTETVTLQPGEKAALELQWETQFRQNIRTAVKLKTNDPERPEVDFFVEGDVVPFVEVSTRQLTIADARTNQVSTATLHVYSRHLEDLEITSVESTHPLVSAEFGPMSEDNIYVFSAKKGYTGAVQVAPGMPIGPFGASLTIRTSCSQRPELTVTVNGKIQGDVILSPNDYLDFRFVSVGKGKTLTLFVHLVSSETVSASVARVTPEFLKDQVKLVETGKNYWRLDATVPRGAPGERFTGKIELETTHPTAKVIKIPVKGQVIQ